MLVGAVFLLRQLVPGFNTDVLWPLAVIVIGAGLLVGALRH